MVSVMYINSSTTFPEVYAFIQRTPQDSTVRFVIVDPIKPPMLDLLTSLTPEPA